MVAAAEARGDGQAWPVKEARLIEVEVLQTEEEALQREEGLREAFAVYDADACYDVRNDTKFSLRTGNKLSPLVVRSSSGQFGTEEMIKNASGPWTSPKTTPPTEIKF